LSPQAVTAGAEERSESAAKACCDSHNTSRRLIDHTQFCPLEPMRMRADCVPLHETGLRPLETRILHAVFDLTELSVSLIIALRPQTPKHILGRLITLY
jgi:hypothetical protein